MKQPFELFAEVEKQTGISKDLLTGRQRKPKLIEGRKMFITLAETEGYSYAAIGRHLNRDHTTILYHAGRV